MKPDRSRLVANHMVVAMLVVAMLVAAIPHARAQEYAARPGDVLDILVIGEPDLSRLVTVSPEGNIFLPLVGTVSVTGLTIPQIEAKLKETFARFIKDPKILVTFRQTAADTEFVYALGQVKKPGPYQYRRGWTLAELLAMAGGPTEQAALRRGLILRRITAIPVNLEQLLAGDTSQNHELKPGDVLMLPEMAVNERVLVLGEVLKPGYQDIRPGERIVDVITRAGGPTLKAAPERISVLRDGVSVTADLEAFLRQGVMDQNVHIQPGDVIFVPETDRRVLVMGEVAKPGPLLLDPKLPERVLDVIMRAGGPTKGANLTGVTILRQNGPKPTGIQVNLREALRNGASDQNVIVKPGDVIYVPGGFSLQLKDIIDLLSGFQLLKLFFGLGP